MCGICGIVFRDPRQQPTAELLRTMANSICHRGPDDEGVEVISSVGLAHRRLSILDLSAAGHQPMSNEDGKIWIVFNGEIYNFQHIRNNLQQQHQFRSNSDSEVLLHLYEECGARMVDQLDGMFAFVIFDTIKSKILMARDAFGIKPLFFSFDDKRLLFGSEIKPLLKSNLVSRELDRTAVHDFFDYMWIPAPRSIYRDIKKLPPATTWELDLATWTVEQKTFWKPKYQPDYNRSFTDWTEQISKEIDRSVQSQMVSDVPLGSFLSGGIDSSLVSYSAVEHRKRTGSDKLKTFTIEFNETAFSERPFAEKVANQLETTAVFRTVSSPALESLAALSEYYDEPFADSSLLPTYAVSKVTREFVTVALSGDGGDELFSGYHHHNLAHKFAKLKAVPDIFNRLLFGTMSELAPTGTRVQDWSERFAFPARLRNFSLIRLPGRKTRADLLSPAWRDTTGSRFEFMEQGARETEGLPPVTQAQIFDLLFYLPNDMLVKVDRASMAHGLEVRVPFLTRAMADLAFQIPEDFRFQKECDKRILRKIMESHFGSELAYRKKQGFAIPLDKWMLAAATPEIEQRILSAEYVQSGILSTGGIRTLFKSIRHGAKHWYTNRSEELFALLVFDAWWTRYQS